MLFLGRAPDQGRWGVTDPATGRIDSERTAVQCYNTHQGGAGRPSQRGYNFPAYRAMKGNVHEYNDYIIKLSDKVNKAYAEHGTDTNRYLWNDFDDTRGKINVARVGDHGPFLLANARANAGLTIYEQSLGHHPATGQEWKSVDWAKTANEARAARVDDVQGKIKTYLDSFYRGTNRGASEHHVVLRSYKRMYDRAMSCRRFQG